MPARTVTTESSTRRAIGRSPISNASAIPARRSQCRLVEIGNRLARSDWHSSVPADWGSRQQTANDAGERREASIPANRCLGRRLPVVCALGQDDRPRRAEQQLFVGRGQACPMRELRPSCGPSLRTLFLCGTCAHAVLERLPGCGHRRPDDIRRFLLRPKSRRFARVQPRGRSGRSQGSLCRLHLTSR